MATPDEVLKTLLGAHGGMVKPQAVIDALTELIEDRDRLRRLLRAEALSFVCPECGDSKLKPCPCVVAEISKPSARPRGRRPKAKP